MLNAMNEGGSGNILKIIALIFITMGVAGLVFMDIGGFFRGGVTDTTVAEVNAVEINLVDFERSASSALRAQNMSMQEAYRFGLVKNLLDEMVQREILRQEALREGIIISRDEIARRVHDMIALQVQPGETPQMALNRILRTQGMSEASLTANLNQTLTNTLIDEPLKISAQFVPELAKQAMNRLAQERRDITFFTLTPEDIGKDIQIDETAVKQFYETIKDQYQISEKRRFKALTLSTDEIKKTISITNDDVKTAYEESPEQFRVDEQRTIEQAVLPSQKEAQEITEKARDGKSLKSLTKKENFRKAVDVTRKGLPSDLAAPVFEADKGTILNPIQTPLGWHVVKVNDIKEPRILPFAEVQKGLKEELESDALFTEMEAQIERIDEALASGDSLMQVAQALNLQTIDVGPIDKEGNFTKENSPVLSALAQNKDLLAFLFELLEGETGDLSEITEGLFAVFSLDQVQPTKDRDFKDVQSEIEKKWLAKQRNAKLNTTVNEFLGSIERGDIDFEDAAKKVGAVVKTARDVSRTSKVAGLNDPVALGRLFDETNLNAVVKVPTEKGTILAKVIKAEIPTVDKAKKVENTDDLDEQWRSQTELAVKNLFIQDLEKRHHVKINNQLLERIYGADSDALAY